MQLLCPSCSELVSTQSHVLPNLFNDITFIVIVKKEKRRCMCCPKPFQYFLFYFIKFGSQFYKESSASILLSDVLILYSEQNLGFNIFYMLRAKLNQGYLVGKFISA